MLQAGCLGCVCPLHCALPCMSGCWECDAIVTLERSQAILGRVGNSPGARCRVSSGGHSSDCRQCS